MKKAILILILVAMLGWTIYEFVDPLSPPKPDQESIVADDDEQENAILSDPEEEIEHPIVEQKVGLEPGDRAPDFKLTTLNGEVISLSDYRGSPVILNFWATWCPPCRAEMPDMEQLYQDTSVEILAINLTETEQSVNQVHDFVDEYQLTFPILMDEEIELAMLYQIQPIPTSFFIDAEGTIQFIAYGALTYEQMIEVLENII